MRIPDFTYHPDPTATGSAAPDDRDCSVCGAVATLRYKGPIYGRQVDVLCLDCIHSGRAAAALAVFEEIPATFTDIDQGESWRDVPEAIISEVLHRTPGFRGWQQERWLAHCNTACEFLGLAGWDELQAFGPDAVDAIRQEMAGYGWSGDDLDDYLRSLSRDGHAIAYVFRCLSCGQHTAYSDMS